MGNYGKNSGSTLTRLKRRFFGKKEVEEVQDIPDVEEPGRFYKRPEKTETRSLENNGCIRYSLDAGSDIYITASDDPFLDYEEPRSSRSESRFLGGEVSASLPASSFSNALPKSRFIDSDFEEIIVSGGPMRTPPQAAATSSAAQAPVSVPVIEFAQKPEYEIETIPETVPEIFTERLPMPPADVERLPSIPPKAEVPAEDIAETSDDVLVVGVYDIPETEVSGDVPTIEKSEEILAIAAPVPSLMLSEPELTPIENERMMEEDEESARTVMAKLPSGLYTEGSAPSAEAVASETEAVTHITECPAQAAVTSAEAQVFVSYADFGGHDFLPPITEPVRREPKAAETISQMPEYVEIEDETGGLMILTVPGIEHDVTEYSDSADLGEITIPDDGMEALGLAIDRERTRIRIEEAARNAQAVQKAAYALTEDERTEALVMLDCFVEAIVSMEVPEPAAVPMVEPTAESAETVVPETVADALAMFDSLGESSVSVETQQVSEVFFDISVLSDNANGPAESASAEMAVPETVADALAMFDSVGESVGATEVSDSYEEEYIPANRPMISFVFNRNGLNSIYDLY